MNWIDASKSTEVRFSMNKLLRTQNTKNYNLFFLSPFLLSQPNDCFLSQHGLHFYTLALSEKKFFSFKSSEIFEKCSGSTFIFLTKDLNKRKTKQKQIMIIHVSIIQNK